MKINLVRILIFIAFLILTLYGAVRLLKWKQGDLSVPFQQTESQVNEAKKSEDKGEPLVPSVLTYLDEEWNEYSNFKYGFTMKIPRQIYYLYGGCAWTTEGGDHSYRPVSSLTPTKIFEEGSNVYISTEYFYRLDDLNSETVGDKFVNYYNSCKKIANNLTEVKSGKLPLVTWKISLYDVEVDEALSDSIAEYFGDSCVVGEKILSKNAATYDVKILEDVGTCNVNYKYEIKYSPEFKKVAFWRKEQTFSFWKDDAKSYDDEISQSFKFVGN